MDLTSPSCTLRRKPDLVRSEFGDEIVLLDLDGAAYYSFDEISAHIWDLLEEGRSFPALIDALLAEFEVERAECEADVLALLQQLTDRGLVLVDGG